MEQKYFSENETFQYLTVEELLENKRRENIVLELKEVEKSILSEKPKKKATE